MFLGFLAAFAVKAPLLPFHGWLRTAYTEAPPELAAILSGVVSKAAVFGLVWIVLPHFPEPVEDFRELVLVLAAATLVYGSVLAFRQPDVRGVIAYSSMGQMGLIVLGIFAVTDLGLDGAVLHSVSHGLVSAGLFLLAAMIESRTGHRALRRARRDGEGPPDPRDARDDARHVHARRARARRTSPASSRSSPACSPTAGATRRSAPRRSCSRRSTRCG